MSLSTPEARLQYLDRPQLEKLCCECYAVVKKETDRLLPYLRNSAARHQHN